MFVKPAEGRVVRRPDTLVHLRPEGEHVPDGDEYWTRRLRDEDVVKKNPPAAVKVVEHPDEGDARATEKRDHADLASEVEPGKLIALSPPSPNEERPA